MSLPQGWTEATLGEVAETRLGKMLDAAKNKGEPVPYLRNVNVRWGSFDLSDLMELKVTDDELAELSVRDGDLFVCEGGEPGRCAVWRGGSRRLVFQKALHRVRGLDGVEPDYLAAFLTYAAANQQFDDLLTGTTIKHFPQVALQRLRLPVPPLAEQRRIVAKLDALTARLARARAELDRVPVLAKTLRGSALTEVFEALQKTPKGRLKELTSKIGSGSTPRGGKAVYVDDGVPFIRSQNVYFEGFDYDGLVRITDGAAKALSGVKVHEQDVLLNITGASIGRACIVPAELIGARVSQHVAIIRPLQKLLPEFLLAFLRTPAIQDWVWNANYGVTRQALTKGMIENIQVPIPPIEEQRRLGERLEAAFARADRLEAEAARARALLDRLESAVLAKAFRGELVPQDPNDEPAQTLLDRIRTERAAAPKAKRGRKAKGG